MKTETLTKNILDDDFETPSCNVDLQMIIEFAFVEYEDKPLFRKEKKQFKIKLNELIEIYNDRRDMNIYNKLK